MFELFSGSPYVIFILFAYRKAVHSSVKYPALKPIFYGPCIGLEVKNPIYQLTSSSGRH